MPTLETMPLEIRLLGPPQVAWQDAPLHLPRRQVRALLYRLAVAPEPVARDVLCALFWPELRPDAAQANLSRLLYFLQQALPEPDLLCKEQDHIALDVARTWVDTWALNRVLTHPHPSMDALQDAADLYRGPFLDGFSLPHAPEYELWVLRQRHLWERRYLDLLTRLVDRAEQAGRLQEAVRWAQRYLEIDEVAEAMHRRLIRLYAALGDREAAARQFERCVLVLERELGVDPLPETRAAYLAAVGRRTEPSPHHPPVRWDLRETLQVPFVGRTALLDRLHRTLDQVRTGRGKVIFIAGEPGVGKTRLLQEFVAGLPESMLPVCITGSEAQQDTPYAALVEGLRALGPALTSCAMDLPPSLRADLARLLPELETGLPPHPPAAPGPPDQERMRLFQALSTLFKSLAHRRPPLLLCLDNLHWLDSSTLAWLGSWLPTVRHLPVLVVATYRSEDAGRVEGLRHSLARQGLLEETTLTGLDREAVQAVMAHLLGEKAVDPAQVECLLRRTGGNPFFLLEILRDLLETDSRDLDAHTLRAYLEATPPPADVEATIRRRLERLSPAERHVLETGAVLGSRFSLEELVQTGGLDEATALEAVERLVARDLLHEEDHTCRFTHDLVREQVYRDMLHARRRLLHRRAAQVLQRLRPEDPAAVARHLQQAGAFREAAHHWLAAGDQARALHAYEDAARHYERALALQRILGDDQAAAQTLLRLGLCYHMAFDFAHARRSYDEGFRLWEQAPRSEPSPRPASRPLRVDWPGLLTLDPARAQDANAFGVIEHLLAGLAEWDPDLNVVPDLARGWTILADGHQYAFHLRPDAVWSDGHPVTARDFVTAWQRVLDPRSSNPFARLLFPIRHAAAYHRGECRDPAAVGVHALDELTLLVELETPCSFFPHLMAHPITRPVPSHVVAQMGDRWCHPDNLVTNGPFRLHEWRWGEAVTLVRSPDYPGRWPGNVETVVLHLGNSSQAKADKWRRFQADELDVFILRWGLPHQTLEELRRRYREGLVSAPNFFVRFLGFDVRRPPFQDVRVRRAFAMATDRVILAQVIWGDLTPARGGLLPPGMPGHSPDAAPAYDPSQARALLAEAGYPDGRGFPDVVLQIFPGAEEIGGFLQRLWRQHLGVDVGVELVPWETYVQHIHLGLAPTLFLAGWIADYPDPDSLLRIPPIQEWTGWHNPEYQDLVERAMRTPDPETRLCLYRQADALLLRELPILPLAYSRWSFLLKPRVRRFPLSPLKWWFWKDVVLL